MSTQNTQKKSENGTEKTKKIRSYRDLKLKALKREKLEDWELKKIAERIAFLKVEKEKLGEQKKAITEELQELKIILNTYKK